MAYDPAQVRAAQVTPRFSVLARTGVDVPTLGTWDANLLHEPRVLVPVDVQAYVVPATGAEPALASSRRAAVQASALASRTGAITTATQGLLPARPAPARASVLASAGSP